MSFYKKNKPTEYDPNNNDTSTTDTTERTTTSSTETYDFEEQIVTRNQWGASEINTSKIKKLNIPIKRIIIAHTRGQFCNDKTNCISTVKSIQTQDSSLDDIPYNYLIGGDGRIYEGRGMEYEGQHTANLDATEYNSIGICIAFIGNYETTAPNLTQLNLLTDFIEFYVRKRLIAADYIIVLQDDLKYFTKQAAALNNEIKKLQNFKTLHKIYRREEWNAQRRTGEPSLFDIQPMNWVLIGHTGTDLCSGLDTCKKMARTIQKNCFERNPPLTDIFYNIFFGDGYAFEGRGFDYWGAHASGFNSITIGLGVIGTFETVAPNQATINAIIKVLDDAMDLGKLSQDYKIFGRNDFRDPGPGTAFMEIIRSWCRYGNRTDPC